MLVGGGAGGLVGPESKGASVLLALGERVGSRVGSKVGTLVGSPNGRLLDGFLDGLLDFLLLNGLAVGPPDSCSSKKLSTMGRLLDCVDDGGEIVAVSI